MSWIYDAMVVPVLTHGAALWWTGTTRAGARSTLDKLQRLACLCITGSMKTAPTRALEALVGLKSLTGRVRLEAARTAMRLTDACLWRASGSPQGHACLWRELLRSYEALQL